MQSQLIQVPFEQLHAGHYQPRQNFNQDALQELAQSICSYGLIEPLIVREIAPYYYEIIAGERRWRAAQIAGLLELPCLVGVYSDKQACALGLIENIQREDLNLIEEASGYKRLIDEFNYQQDEIALLVGKSRSHIANIVRLLSLSTVVKNYLTAELLSLGHARMLVALEPAQQEWFAHQIIEKQWTVRLLEQEIREYKNKPAVLKNSRVDRDVDRLQRILAEQVGAPVHIVNGEKDGGWLKVRFFDNDTLAGLLERLGLHYE